MLSPRWRKMLRDVQVAKVRMGLMVAALAIGIFALTTMVTAYAVLTREVSRNYLATNPASALFEVGRATPQALALIRSNDDIATAEPGSIIEGRAETAPGKWDRLLLFVIPDTAGEIGKVFPEAGEFPPPAGSLALEREALKFVGGQLGDTLRIELPEGIEANFLIDATVHDPALAPAWQEQTVYAYLTASSLATFSPDGAPELVKVVARDAVFDQERVDAVVAGLADELRRNGIDMHQAQVPPAGLHPHQSQMGSVLAMFLAFAGLIEVLSAILTAAMVTALLAQQVRPIAIMKTVGGTTRQLAALYVALLAAIAVAATAIGLPLGLLAGRGFVDLISGLLNLEIASYELPLPVLLGLGITGIVAPLAFVWQPIRRATRVTVREALADYAISRERFGATRLQQLLGVLTGVDRTLVLALRNAFRRKGRLLLNTSLLGVAGAIFLASLNVELAWQGELKRAEAERHYDIELRFQSPHPIADIAAIATALPGIGSLEPASVLEVAPGRPDGLALVRTYPDAGHGSLSLRRRIASPPDGVYLTGGEANGDAVVLNQSAWQLLGRPEPGSDIAVNVEGELFTWPLAGAIRQVLVPATIYAKEQTFKRSTGLGERANAVRLTTDTRDPATISRLASELAGLLQGQGFPVTQIITGETLRQAQAGHVEVLVVSLLAISIVVAAVGIIGLASSQATAVTERIREFGIMRTIGAPDRAIIRNVLAEGAMVGLISLPLALLLGLPLGYAIGLLVGTLSFGLALPLTVSASALLVWIGLLLAGSVASSLIPALTATRITVRQALAHL